MTVSTAPRSGADVLAALEQRLREAALVLLSAAPAEPDLPPGGLAARLLPELVEYCRPPERTDARWLLLTALAGAFPTPAQLQAFGRRLQLANTYATETDLLARVLADPDAGAVGAPMTVVRNGVLADVDYCARHEAHTGIHRVVRETVRRWYGGGTVEPVAWIDQYSAFRTLSAEERARVLGPDAGPTADGTAPAERLVVPWQSTVVLPDVPKPRVTEPLTAMARFSGNTLGLVGYDMIPIISAETRPASDSVTFAQYLTVVKHSHRVAGISRSSSTEFAGFVQAVRAQGLAGPEVGTVRLPSEPPSADRSEPVAAHARAVVLCPGSREPHKNHRAVLHAAERLWREGLDFEIRMVGGQGWSEGDLQPAIERLRNDRRPLVELGRVSDAELTVQMRSASFAVFASLHEGYGLPVVEALACGTPVVTSNFGSQAEIAAEGGCLTVDPRDDDQLTAALRRLLTDPGELARLRAEARARPQRSWDDYADDLWQFLVVGKGGTP